MNSSGWVNCVACEEDTAAGRLDECRDAFKRIGLSKLHWECWSDCNLHCKFCYRTVDTPLGVVGMDVADAGLK